MKKITLLIAFLLSFLTIGYGQTVLINPSAEGGFANGATFAANGWTVANSANNPWVIGTVASNATMTGNVAYVSSTSGTTHAFATGTAASNYFWRDVTVPAGETKINLNFNWYGQGESTYDLWQVFVAPITVTPASTTTSLGTGVDTVPAGIAGATFVGYGNLSVVPVQYANLTLPPSVAGTTFRLIFHWKNDGSGGAQPPAAIDNISLTSQVPGGDFISIASGSWNSPSTWNLNKVPNYLDNSVTIAAGHTVTIDAAPQSSPNIVVDGTLSYGALSGSFIVNGNLTVAASGAINAFNGTLGKDLTVSGNLTNNGTINLSVGTAADGSLTLTGSGVQTVSGSGTFTGNLIRNLNINNTSTAVPNINWSVNNISIDYNLTITNAKINLGTNKLTYGTSATSAGNNFVFTNGGFMPGGKFARWWSATGTGYTTSAPGSLPTGTGGRYPFYTPTGSQRVFYLGRSTASAGGIYAVSYTDAPTPTTGLSIVDGTYTVTDRYNSNFVVTTESTSPAAASYWVSIFQPGAYIAANGNARVMGQNAAIGGTHVPSTGSIPGAQRSGISLADLTAATGLYVGINTADIAFYAITNGNWNVASTWNKNAVPGCADSVIIPAGTNVTVNSAANSIKGLTINTGGTVTIASGDLTVGCAAFNNTLTNNGTLTVTGGTLNVNGNMLHSSSSTFNQSGGDINVDGNDAGAAATSVASGTAIVQISTNLVNWTGGMLTIVDPHANTSSTYAFQYNGANVEVGAGHTLRFGNGTSLDAGGSSSYGFRYYIFQGSGRMIFNNIIVNGGSGTNRYVTTAGAHGIKGDLTITAGSEFRDTGNTIYLGKDIINNGNYLATGTLYLGTYVAGTAGATTNAQTISGAGTFVNNATPANVTGNLSTLTVNNTNATGVTLNVPLTVSGTLNLTAGKVNTGSTSVLTLGTTTAAGTLNGGGAAAYISGPFARTIGASNANTNYIAFPVGKTAYAPVSVAPLTTAVTVMKAEAFDTNAGTADPSIINLAANRRWEVPVVSGTVTNLNVRLGDANIIATNIPVMSSTAAGAYAASFGSVATFTAGTPNTTQSNNNIAAANYTGFLSFADSNACSGTPAPGTTTASVNNICQGTPVTFTVQNGTTGSGVTYQWQSSANGTTWTDIAGATATTLTTVPAASLYYRLNVTCASGPSTGSSTPVQILFTGTAPAATGATRCGEGSVTVNAVPASGTTIEWFDAVSGGNYKGSGSALTTNVTASTQLYAASSVITTGNAILGTGTSLTGATDVLTAFNNRFSGYRMQIIYTAAELQAAGLTAGNITSLAFNTTTAGDGLTNDSFTVKLGSITGNAFPTATYVTTGLNTVYGPVTHTHTASGWQVINFTTPYNWDGFSNIIVDVSMLGANATNNAITYYTPTTGVNSIIYSTGATSASGTLSANRLNIQFGGQRACRSPRTAAAVTVTTPPVLTLSGNPAAVCNGQSTAPVTITAGAADYNAFTWTPSTGVAGNAATGWTFNPAVSTQYTLTASQTGGSLCNAVPVSINVVINALPSSAIALPATLSVCAQSTQAISLTNAIGPQTITMGTGTTAPSSTSWPNPFSAWYGGTKTQMLFTAEELTAQGLMPGTTINVLSFDFNASVANALNDFRIKIGTSTNSAMTGFVASSTLTTVYNASYTPVAGTTGLVSFTLSTPYTWNGGNIIVEVAHNQGNSGNGAGTTTRTTTTTFNSVYSGASDSVTPAGVASFDALTSYGTSGAYNARPNIVFGYTPSNTVVWTPATNLFTDAAATIPYTNQSIATVYTKPTANITYTATVTNAASCQLAKQVAVTYVNTPAPTVAASTQNICNAGTVADLVATGTAIKWYAATTGGTALATTTALVNGTTYYASQTANGCESLTRVALTANITVISAPTVPAATQDFCNAATVADLVATGSGIKWYAAATGGTALAATTALVNGTQYFASQTVNGCESIVRTGRTANITAPAAPTVATATPVFCNTATVADLVATGSNIKWYAAATGGTELVATTALVSGTAYYASQTINGCEGLQRATVTPTINVTPTPTVDAATQTFCNAATVADLTANGTDIKWYAAATGGTALLSTDVLVNGTAYYASQTLNACESAARVQRTAVINVVAAPTVDAATQTFCNAGTVAELTVTGIDVKWYDAETAGNLLDGTTALVNGNVYYASQTIDGCEGITRVAKTAVINVVVAPSVDAEQEFCDAGLVADLVATGSDVKWYDAETAGNLLTDETELANGSVYYASQTIEGCEGLSRAAVTVVIHNVVVDTPADVAVCTEYVLPALTSGAYYTEANGAGTQVAAGTTVTATTTFYVYAQEGTDVVCSDESSFTVTVANIPAPTGEATQVVTVNDASLATIDNLVVTAVEGGTILWYATAEDAAAGTNPLAAGTVVTNGSTYYAVQTVGECTSPALAVTVEVVLGRDGFDPKAFTYHPNPVKDVLNISYSSDITSVTVFNLLGQQVMTLAPNATDVKIDMSSLADAPYVVNVTAGNTVKTIKVIKKQ